MELLWRALNVVHDVFAAAPAPIHTLALIVFVVGLVVAWALLSSRHPVLGIIVNVAILARVGYELVAAHGPRSPNLFPMEGLLAFVTYAAQAVIACFGVTGLCVSIPRLVERLRDDGSDDIDG